MSAVSYGIPERKLLNRTFLPLLMETGLDVVILDPVDRRLMATLKASKALLDKDEYCLEYLTAFRERKLADKEG